MVGWYYMSMSAV